jgi:hypothetical protein
MNFSNAFALLLTESPSPRTDTVRPPLAVSCTSNLDRHLGQTNRLGSLSLEIMGEREL